MVVMRQITQSRKVPFPKEFDSNAKSLIKHLCDHDLTKRYGFIKDGISMVKNHRFFAELDWEKLKNKMMEAPYIPPVKQTKWKKEKRLSYN